MSLDPLQYRYDFLAGVGTFNSGASPERNFWRVTKITVTNPAAAVGDAELKIGNHQETGPRSVFVVPGSVVVLEPALAYGQQLVEIIGDDARWLIEFWVPMTRIATAT